MSGSGNETDPGSMVARASSKVNNSASASMSSQWVSGFLVFGSQGQWSAWPLEKLDRQNNKIAAATNPTVSHVRKMTFDTGIEKGDVKGFI